MPYAGGLFDQPYGAVVRIEKIKQADYEVEEAEEKTAESKAAAEKRLEEKYGPKSA